MCIEMSKIQVHRVQSVFLRACSHGGSRWLASFARQTAVRGMNFVVLR